MPIAVEHGHNGRVSSTGSDFTGTGARGDPERDSRVAQIVLAAGYDVRY
jgi:hypothetical protein